METRHPADGSFGNDFPSIYNHCGVMAALSRKTLKKFDFCVFWKNDPLSENFRNSVPKEFIATPIEIGNVVHYLPDKKIKISLGSPALATARIAPRQCTQSAFIQIGSLSAELYLNARTLSERARKWMQYSAEAYLQPINKNLSGDEIANVNFFYNIAHVEASAYAHWTSS